MYSRDPNKRVDRVRLQGVILTKSKKERVDLNKLEGYDFAQKGCRVKTCRRYSCKYERLYSLNM